VIAELRHRNGTVAINKGERLLHEGVPGFGVVRYCVTGTDNFPAVP
jgi:hypothetical protein